MQKLKITPLQAFSENQKGRSFELSGPPTEQFILAYRKKGSVSGRHWHEGKSESKNPETLLLVSGEVELAVEDLHTGEKAVERISAPAKVEIRPMLFHSLTAISDCCFLEFNSLDDHKADTQYPDQNP